MSRFIVLAQSRILDMVVSYFDRLGRGEGLWRVAVELLLIAVVVYAALRFLQGTRGERLLKSFGLILITSFLIVRLVAEEFGLDRIVFLYPYFVGGVALTTLIAFQPEVRRGLIRLGETRWLRRWSRQTERTIDSIVAAVASLSQKKIGALIAIQRDVGIEAVIDAGVRLDAEVRAELLETIFWPGSVLHDLGVVIRHGRIAAAACQFPMAEASDVALSLGSRHRAALGMSQESDALVVVVSEETGTISVASAGVLHRHLSPNALCEMLIAGSQVAEARKMRSPTSSGAKSTDQGSSPVSTSPETAPNPKPEA